MLSVKYKLSAIGTFPQEKFLSGFPEKSFGEIAWKDVDFEKFKTK